MRFSAPAIIAALALSIALPAMALADDDSPKAALDLGVDISSVARTPAGVSNFLSTLAPETRQMVVSGCETYVAFPAAASAPMQTVPFCEVAVAL